ncbi:nucleotide excision repair, TFIIH, subunit [Exidia glandulosa HHB12029]|uniref:General transcription and DNA repair factor IIH subunit TFB5 n=1 Tax=Exidia glandulosa HHB12029 TaxID=1314781 RepID=A0A165BQX9_EXIGL|nr:nucleotide excision repair, TFIIH, subunit [Exidia glandulosa HHB12029]
MKAIKGVLLTCDSAVKQLLIMMDERSSGSATFIIQDLDEHHLLIKADEHERVKRELEAELEKNSYTADL